MPHLPVERLLLVSVAALAVLAAGCGGGGKAYSVGPFRTCVANHSLTFAAAHGDYIARDASGGGGGIRFEGNRVNVGFERSADQAGKEVRQLEMMGDKRAMAYNVGNVYISWDKTPTDQQKRVVEGCLS